MIHPWCPTWPSQDFPSGFPMKTHGFSHHRLTTVPGVCGAVSKFGASCCQAFGVAAMPVGQPGHCAMIWRAPGGRQSRRGFRDGPLMMFDDRCTIYMYIYIYIYLSIYIYIYFTLYVYGILWIYHRYTIFTSFIEIRVPLFWAFRNLSQVAV